MKKRKKAAAEYISADTIMKRRKIVEIVSTIGLLMICSGLVAPFFRLGEDGGLLAEIFKWIYAAGALVYTGARMVPVNAAKDSARLKRLRRMEVWAGLAFCAGAFFWFYNSARMPGIGFTLGIMNDTIMFTLAGAVIQIVASWMIAVRSKKEQG